MGRKDLVDGPENNTGGTERDPCPLCQSSIEGPAFYQDSRRTYFRCDTCQLVYVPSKYHLSPSAEKAEYDQHQNSPDDAGYRKFLSRIFCPLNQRLSSPGQGLDFGSGPGPTLSIMFEEVGHSMSVFDPFYAPHDERLKHQYDFATASEVVEHLRNPAEDLRILWDCVKPEGLLGIMTKRVIDRDAFSKWHYINDPTHVCFYSDSTFRWLARNWGADLAFEGSDVVIFQKTKSLSV